MAIDKHLGFQSTQATMVEMKSNFVLIQQDMSSIKNSLNSMNAKLEKMLEMVEKALVGKVSEKDNRTSSVPTSSVSVLGVGHESILGPDPKLQSSSQEALAGGNWDRARPTSSVLVHGVGGSILGTQKGTSNSQKGNMASYPYPTSNSSIDGILKNLRLEFPKFSGDDVYSWLRKCEHIFSFHHLSDNQKLFLVTLNLEGEADLWYQGFASSNSDLTWKHFVNEICIKFLPEIHVNVIEGLRELQQNGSDGHYGGYVGSISFTVKDLAAVYSDQICRLHDIPNSIVPNRDKILVVVCGQSLVDEVDVSETLVIGMAIDVLYKMESREGTVNFLLVGSDRSIVGRLEDIYIFRPLQFNFLPVVETATKPLIPRESKKKKVEGLRKNSKRCPLAITKVEDFGEHTILVTGELYLDSVLKDLRDLCSVVEVKVAISVLSFCEIVVESSSMKCFAGTFNKKNEITIITEPLEEGLAKGIANGVAVVSLEDLMNFFVLFAIPTEEAKFVEN